MHSSEHKDDPFEKGLSSGHIFGCKLWKFYDLELVCTTPPWVYIGCPPNLLYALTRTQRHVTFNDISC